jgi:hypothetical protein
MSPLNQLLPNLGVARGVLPPFSGEYARRVLNTYRANLLAYWPLWDTSGTTAIEIKGFLNGSGGHTTLGFIGPDKRHQATYFNGTNTVIDIYSAALAAAFDGDEGSFLAWAKVSGAGVWTDSTYRDIIRIYNQVNNYTVMFKGSVDNSLYIGRKTDTEEKYSYGLTYGALTDWFCTVGTWSTTNDKLILHVNGVQAGLTASGLGAMAGSPDPSYTVIGASAAAGGVVWSGYLAHVAIWSAPLDAETIKRLSRVN